MRLKAAAFALLTRRAPSPTASYGGKGHKLRKVVDARGAAGGRAPDRRPVRALSRRLFAGQARGEAGLRRTSGTECPRDSPTRSPLGSRLYVKRPGHGSGCDDLFADPRTGVALAVSQSRNVRSRCRCSVCPAIHINSRSWLRSSSTHEPSDPPHRVVSDLSSRGPPAQHGRSACALAPEKRIQRLCVVQRYLHVRKRTVGFPRP